MAKLPSFQFYPGDWMKDPELRSVSVAARGLWIDMLCLMFESSQRGYLLINGKAPTVIQLARMAGCTMEELNHCLNELKDAGVLSQTNKDVIYSRRMVRDAEIRNIRSKCGKLGGNPGLLNQNANKTKANIRQTINQKSTPSSSTSSSTSLQRDEQGSPVVSEEGQCWNVEHDLHANRLQWERICMNTGKDATTAYRSLTKYHLWLLENERYPKSRKALYAGFQKWLMNEKKEPTEQHETSLTKQSLQEQKTKAILDQFRK